MQIQQLGLEFMLATTDNDRYGLHQFDEELEGHVNRDHEIVTRINCNLERGI